MELRIKELLQEKGLRMADLAVKLGTNQSNLAKSLARNPTLSTLQDVARALNVDIHELFSGDHPSRPVGIAVIGGKTFGIAEMANVVQLPSYTDYSTLRKDVRSFVQNSVKEETPNAFGAFVNSFELFSLVYDEEDAKFILSLYFGNGQARTFFFDKMDYAEWSNGKDTDPDWNLEQIIQEMISVIEDVVPNEDGEE